MKRICRRLTLVAALAAVGCVVSSRAAAQPFVATTNRVPDVCTNPAEGDCSRGILYIVNGTTFEIQSSMNLWQGVTNTFVSKLLVHPDGTRGYAAQRVGTATTTTSEWIDVIDLRTMTKTATYGVTGDPLAISPDGLRLYIQTPTAIQVIDSATGSVLSSIAAASPSAVAVAPGGGRVYISGGTFGAYSIAVVDGGTYAPIGTIAVTNSVSQLEVTEDGAHLYALAPTSRIFDIDTASNTIAGTITDFGGPSSPNRLSLSGGRAYVAASFQSPGVALGEGIAVIDIATRAFVTKINLVDPIDVEASADGSRVWAIGLGSPRLTTIDTATNQIVNSSAALGTPYPLAAIPAQRRAEIVIDQPAAGAVLDKPFTISGWAVDLMGLLPGPGVNTVHVWAFPADGRTPTFVGADYGRPRLDVGALFGPSFTNSGYEVTVQGLLPGVYQLIAFAFSARTGQFSITRAVQISIVPSAQLVVDAPRNDRVVPARFTIAGWARDSAAAAGTGIDGIHVWAYPATGGTPIFAGAATLGDPRPDVGAYYGAQFGNSGYHLEVSTLAPGTYTLVVYGHSTVTHAFSVEQHVRVTIGPRQPMMWIDTPAPNAIVGGTFSIAGWALEFNSPTGTGVDLIHVWATSTTTGVASFQGAATYGLNRPDILGWLGPQYSASGFSLTGSLAPGTYWLSIYAHSTETGTFRQWRTVQITVQ
jgi:hypothetical protein